MSLSNLFLPFGLSWDSALGQGSCGPRRDPDTWTAVLLVLPKEGGQDRGPRCYPLSPVRTPLALGPFLHSLPTFLSCAVHAVGAQ